MHIGLITDSLRQLPLEEVLNLAAELRLESLEFGTGGWSTAPHHDLDGLLESEDLRDSFLDQLSEHRLRVSALTCSGNPLHPGPSGRVHDAVTRKTIALARLLGVKHVVMMSAEVELESEQDTGLTQKDE